MAAITPQRAAITTQEAVFRVLIQEKMKHLHTSDFKQLYKLLKTPLPPLNFLLLGGLVWVEQQYLQIKIKANVDDAIKQYHSELDSQEPKKPEVKGTGFNLSIGIKNDENL